MYKEIVRQKHRTNGGLRAWEKDDWAIAYI